MTTTAPRQSSVKRGLPALGLFFLAPLVAEFLLGNIPLTGLFALFGLAPLYGGGAVLIRELVRRRGWGYPSVLILALAYGVLEEGITTQSLFNPNYVDQRLLDPGHIGFLGMGAPWTLFVLGLHTVGSITVPIVLTESISRRPREPWLGKIGVSVYGALFVVGVLATTAIQLKNDSFVASPAQFAGVAVAIVALVMLATAVGRRASRRTAGAVPSVLITGAAVLVLGSGWMLADDLPGNGWPTAAVLLLLELVTAALLTVWSRRSGWTQRHSMAAAGGALLTYAWHAFPETPVFDASRTVDLIGNTVFALLALVLLVFATIRCEKFSRP
ncbi:hypothetical protein [Kribbella speibonae]|uniref:DUF998 domain-containing protein n=1 Tax=Kribbella speibonae TaxID=1572660 RepID=A0A4R0J7T2_9ACTN|nr:hypothetical protein [Kribbella speibonae]TCC41314.1 hypothetical protein E0H92_06515 [Kribbella speibonae]